MALVLGLWGGEGTVEDYGFETSQIQHPIPSHKEPGIRRQAKHGQKLSTAATKNDESEGMSCLSQEEATGCTTACSGWRQLQVTAGWNASLGREEESMEIRGDEDALSVSSVVQRLHTGSV